MAGNSKGRRPCGGAWPAWLFAIPTTPGKVWPFALNAAGAGAASRSARGNGRKPGRLKRLELVRVWELVGAGAETFAQRRSRRRDVFLHTFIFRGFTGEAADFGRGFRGVGFRFRRGGQ